MSKLVKWFIYIVIAGCIVFGIASFAKATVGNKDIVDFGHNDFKYAYINLGDEVIKVDVARWNDYEGEQLQVVTKDGQLFLSGSNNIVLVGE